MNESVDRLAAGLVDRYRIERELGRGGMATVFLAHDLKHDRDVAIKVLHPDLGAALGAERFLAEIRTTARLQHPHILPLLDSGDAAGALYYVMPFVAGETLRARLERERQLPVGDALRIAREVADALTAAHEKGIVHRDIKPENVLLQSGHALVSDFGIALAVQHAAGQRMTQTGLSLGTPHYMSPEQAMGEKTIDARSDIYALGAVVYEMLTGEPPFTGATVQAIVAKVLTEKPTSIRTVRDTVPSHVDAAVLTALAKLPADRFTTAAEFATALSAPLVTGDVTTPHPRAASVSTPRRSLLFGAIALSAVIAAFAAGRATGSQGERAFTRFGKSTQVTWEPGLELTPAISPDGKMIAYSAGNGTASKIFVRPVAGGRVTALTDDSTAVEAFPEWSRDGTRILYVSNGRVFSAPSSGGPPRQEVPGAGRVATATWSPDGKRIAYAVGDSVFIHDVGGNSHSLATFREPSLCTWGPRELIACAAGNGFYLTPGIAFGNIIQNWIAVVNAADGSVRSVTDSLSSHESPRWSEDGHSLVYISNEFGTSDLFMVPMSDDGHATAEPRRLTTGLNANSFSISPDESRIAYSVMTTSSNVWSQPWTGAPPVLGTRPTQITFGQQTIEDFSISRDGKRIYYDSDLAGNSDLYRRSLPSGVAERLTSTPASEFAPDPSPDEREVVFHSLRGASRDVLIVPLDGGPVSAVAQTPAQEMIARWSPDGRQMSYSELGPQGGIRVARRNDNGTWGPGRRLANGFFSAWSPDGRFISYTTALFGGGMSIIPVDSGPTRALYDASRPGMPAAEMSAWSDDGRMIFFKSHSATGAASIWSVPSAGGTPQRVLELGDDRLRADRYTFRISNGRLYYTLLDRQSNVWIMEVDRR